jgi:DNA repair exonuclease SbcCD ATPase subunit
MIALALLLIPSGSAQIADSTENFLSRQIAGFLDSLVVSEITSMYDVVMYIIIPFLGTYGIMLYLTRKSLQIAEDNFRDNSPGTSELSDQAKKTTTLIAATVSAVTVSAWGGFTPVIVLLLALTGVSFLVWQFWGAFRETRWESDIGETATQVEEAENRIEREEQQAQQESNPEPARRAEAEMSNVVAALQSQAGAIEKLEEREEADLERLLERMKQLIGHRRREIQALEKYRTVSERCQELEDLVFQDLEEDELKRFHEVFLDFQEDNSDLGPEAMMDEWRNHEERSAFYDRLDTERINLSDLRSRFEDSDISGPAGELQDIVEEVLEFEKSQISEIREEKQWVQKELDHQKKVFEASRKFVEELDRLHEEKVSLESLHSKLSDLDNETELDDQKIELLERKTRELEQKQQEISGVLDELEGLEDEEIQILEQMDSLDQLHEDAMKRFSAWLMLVDLGSSLGEISEDSKLAEKLQKVLETLRDFNTYLNVLKSRIEREESGERDIESMIQEVHRTASQNLTVLSQHSSN